MTKKRGSMTLAGQAALSTIFLIGGIIVLFGVSLAVITLTLANSTLGFQAANRALASAMAGVEDAELQILRNKDFEDVSGYCVPYSSAPCPQGYATVTVTQDSPSAGQATVLSDAIFNRRRRKVQAVYSISQVTGQLFRMTIEEITL